MWRAEIIVDGKRYGADGKTESEAKRNLQALMVKKGIRGEHTANTFQWEQGPTLLKGRFS